MTLPGVSNVSSTSFIQEYSFVSYQYLIVNFVQSHHFRMILYFTCAFYAHCDFTYFYVFFIVIFIHTQLTHSFCDCYNCSNGYDVKLNM